MAGLVAACRRTSDRAAPGTGGGKLGGREGRGWEEMTRGERSEPPFNVAMASSCHRIDCAAAARARKRERTPIETPPPPMRSKARSQSAAEARAVRSVAAKEGTDAPGAAARRAEGAATKRSGSEATRKTPRAGAAGPDTQGEADKTRQ